MSEALRLGRDEIAGVVRNSIEASLLAAVDKAGLLAGVDGPLAAEPPG